jgi:hypothetical protein
VAREPRGQPAFARAIVVVVTARDVVAVLDPLLQIGVQHLGWSSGLLIEVGFFVPAGLALLVVSR